MTKLLDFFTAPSYSSVCVEGKTYKRSEENGEVVYLVRCNNGALRRLHTPVIKAKIDAAIVLLAEIEAYREDELRAWESITPEQVVMHDKRVLFGIELKARHNVDDVLTACHAEALEINQVLDTSKMVSDLMVKHSTPYAIDAVHAEALEMNAEVDRRRALNAERTRNNEVLEVAGSADKQTMGTAEKQQKLEIIWRKTHADYKSVMDGERMIMICRGGTCSVPLSDLTDSEINQRVSARKTV